jgi:hypothetical protein
MEGEGGIMEDSEERGGVVPGFMLVENGSY